MRKSRLIFFATKCVKTWFMFSYSDSKDHVFLAPNIYTDLHSISVKCAGVWVKHSVRSLYVTLKEFTPNLQIFCTFFVFGLNV